MYAINKEAVAAMAACIYLSILQKSVNSQHNTIVHAVNARCAEVSKLYTLL